MKRDEFRFFDHLRVRWAEIDAQIVLQRAPGVLRHRGGRLLARAGRPMRHHGSFRRRLYVRKATIEYHGSARYDDRLDVGAALRTHRQPAPFSAAYSVWVTLVEGPSWSTCSSPPATRRPRAQCPPPHRTAQRLRITGPRSARVARGSWDTAQPRRQGLRTAVFVRGKHSRRDRMGCRRRQRRCTPCLQPARPAAGHRAAAPCHQPGVARSARIGGEAPACAFGSGTMVLRRAAGAGTPTRRPRVLLHAQTSGLLPARRLHAARGRFEAGIPPGDGARALEPSVAQPRCSGCCDGRGATSFGSRNRLHHGALAAVPAATRRPRIRRPRRLPSPAPA